MIKIRDLREIIMSRLHSPWYTREIEHPTVMKCTSLSPNWCPCQLFANNHFNSSAFTYNSFKILFWLTYSFVCIPSLSQHIQKKSMVYVYRILTYLSFETLQYDLYPKLQNCFLQTYYNWTCLLIIFWKFHLHFFHCRVYLFTPNA